MYPYHNNHLHKNAEILTHKCFSRFLTTIFCLLSHPSDSNNTKQLFILFFTNTAPQRPQHINYCTVPLISKLQVIVFFILFFSCSNTLKLRAQIAPPTYFETIFGNDTITEKALGVKQLASGSIFLAGYSNLGQIGNTDISLSKLSSNGTLLWTRYYGTVAYNDYCNAMITNSAGHFVLIGRTDTDDTTKAIMVKIDTTGALLQMTQSNSGYPIEVYEYIQETPDGGYIVAGFNTQASGGPNDMLMVKFNADFEEEWRQNFGGTFNDVGYSIQNTADGGFILAGDSHSFSPNVGIYVVKTDQNGNFEWDLLINTDYATGIQNIITTNNGDYFLVGESSIDSSGAFDVIMARISPEGQLLWTNFWGGIGSDAGFAVREVDDGSFYISGYSTTPNPDAPYEILWLKTDANGNEIAHQYFEHPSIDIAYDFCPSIYGGWLIAGMITLNGNGQYYLAYTTDPIFTDIQAVQQHAPLTPTLFGTQGQIFCQLNLDYTSAPIIQLFNTAGQHIYTHQWPMLPEGTHTLTLANLPIFLPNACYYFKIETTTIPTNNPTQPAKKMLGCGQWLKQ